VARRGNLVAAGYEVLVKRFGCQEESSMKAEETVAQSAMGNSGLSGTRYGSRWEFACEFLAARLWASMEAGEPGWARAHLALRDTFRRRMDMVRAKQWGSEWALRRLELVYCSWLCIIAAE